MGALIVARRELAGYFAAVAYVFIVIFLMMAGALTFTLGGFFARGQADLSPFFTFVPWLFLFLVSADNTAVGRGTAPGTINCC